MKSSTFGTVVAALLKQSGESVYQFARRAGLTPQALYHLRNGRRQPTLDTARRIAAAAGLTLGHLEKMLPKIVNNC